MELARQVGRLDAQVRRGDWGGIDGIGLHGKKLGLVGFGGIGRTVARIANGFGMKTLVLEQPCARHRWVGHHPH